ncbi:MAG: hypothetical protein MUF54_04110 [Polyangiaceae bacterium]|jgi:hypothetical protein|nr:hypothetical protein [Polyangiaceae bacterium]
MRTTKFLLVLLTLVFAVPTAVCACGGGSQHPKMAAVKPGNMPSGASWDGVYYNAIWGYLHIVTDGGKFRARWKRADESAFGEMDGTITGDVARFDWSEHKVGMVGQSATTKGKGYFRYTRPEGDNVDDMLLGQWGLEDAEVGGGEWDAIKQRNLRPNLDAVGGEAEPGVGGWR